MNQDPRTQLEEAFSECYKVPYVLTTSSGTAAYLATLLVARAYSEGQVVLSAYNWPQLLAVPRELKMKVRLVDCDTEGRMSLEELQRALSETTSVVVVSHLFGNPSNIRKIARMAARRSVMIIEDCSQSLFSRQAGRLVGTWGDFGFASLGKHKSLSAVEGGLLWTHSRDLYRLAFALTQHPERARDPLLRERCLTSSFSLRMHPAGAEIALKRLQGLKERVESSSARLEFLRVRLSMTPGIRVVKVYQDASPCWQHLPLLFPKSPPTALKPLLTDQFPAHVVTTAESYPNAKRFDSQVCFLRNDLEHENAHKINSSELVATIADTIRGSHI